MEAKYNISIIQKCLNICTVYTHVYADLMYNAISGYILHELQTKPQ